MDFVNSIKEQVGIKVQTLKGYKQIEAIGITKADSHFLTIHTDSGFIECSEEHLVSQNGEWIKAQDASSLDTIFGNEKIKSKTLSIDREDLYDIQVEDKEYVINGLYRVHNSTLVMYAATLALFDKSYDPGCTKPSLVNTRSNKDCIVEIEFETKGSHWLVRRGIKPNIFDIIRDGVRVEDEAATKDYQAYLISVIGITEKVFMNSVALGASRFVPFASMTPAERRAYVEPILDIAIFSDMNEIAKTKQKNLNTAKVDIDYRIDLNESKLAGSKRVIAVLNDTIARKSADTTEQIRGIESTIEETQNSINALDESKDSELNLEAAALNVLAASVAKIDKINDRKSVLQNEITVRQKLGRQTLEKEQADHKEVIAAATAELGKYPKDLAAQRDKIVSLTAQFATKIAIQSKTRDDFIALDDCPTCRQAVTQETKDHRCAELNPEIDKLELASKELTKKLLAIDEQIAEVNNINASIVELHNVGAAIQNKLSVYDSEAKQEITSSMSDINAELTDAVSQRSSIEANLNLIKSRISGIDNQIRTANQQITAYTAQIAQIKKQSEDGGEAAKLEAETAAMEETNTTLEALRVEAAETMKAALDTSHLLLMLKDEGVKAQIVKQYVPFLNQKINHYLDKLGLFINLTMDEEYNLKMFSPDRKGQSLGNLSAGQTRRVDLAVMLAWREVARLKSSVSCNVLLLDEVLESLSEVGVNEFFELWDNDYEGNDVNLVVITQRNAEFSEYFDRTVTYALKDDQTILLEEK